MAMTVSKVKMNEMILKGIKDDFGIVIPTDVTIERFDINKNMDNIERGLVGPVETSIRIIKRVGKKSIAIAIEIQET